MKTSGYVVAAAFAYRMVPPLFRPPFAQWLQEFGLQWNQMSEQAKNHFKNKAQYLRSNGLASVHLDDWELLLDD